MRNIIAGFLALLLSAFVFTTAVLATPPSQGQYPTEPTIVKPGQDLVARCNIASGKIVYVSPREQSENLSEDLTLCQGEPTSTPPPEPTQPTTVIEEPPTTVIEEPPTTVIEEPPTTVIEEPPTTVIEEPPTTVIEEPPTTVVEPPTTVVEPPTTIIEPPEPTKPDNPKPNNPDNPKPDNPKPNKPNPDNPGSVGGPPAVVDNPEVPVVVPTTRIIENPTGPTIRIVNLIRTPVGEPVLIVRQGDDSSTTRVNVEDSDGSGTVEFPEAEEQVLAATTTTDTLPETGGVNLYLLALSAAVVSICLSCVFVLRR